MVVVEDYGLSFYFGEFGTEEKSGLGIMLMKAAAAGKRRMTFELRSNIFVMRNVDNHDEYLK